MPNKKSRRRRFGAVRELPSGRWQARYQGPDGVMRPADQTFATKTDAEVWLTRKEAEILDGDWIDPDAGKVKLADYGAAWIEERPNLRPKTIRLYRYLLRSHIAAHFENVGVNEIKEPQVRRWRKKLLDSEVSEVTTAKAYRLLKAILNTAVDDGMIRRNPCRIKGAGQEESAERPTLTIAEVYALADAIDQQYRVLVLLGTFASLRWAELAALRRCDIDTASGEISVSRQLIEQLGGGHAFGPPKSRAGKRVVPFPALLNTEVAQHLSQFVGEKDDALVFTSPAGAPMRHSNFYRRAWLPAVRKVGLAAPGVHFHDLRHTGNTLTADAGANLRELMERMGHSSTRAALVYLHSTSDRQRSIADAVGNVAKAALAQADNPETSEDGRTPSGTKVARRRSKAS
jgi:integrase